MPLKHLLAACAACALAASAHADEAAAFPQQPIRLVVPYAPGGLPDTMARSVGRHMSDALGQQVVVENRPGAAGIIASELVAKAPPNGYTLLVADQAQLAINPVIYKNLPYDHAKAFAPISLIGVAPLFLVGHPSLPADDFPSLIRQIKANPGKFSYGSTGIGSLHHIAMESLKASLGLDMIHVPFKGTGQATPAVVGGQVSLVLAGLPSVTGFLANKQLKIYAVNSAHRSPQAPEVPTIAEQGVPGYDFTAEIGLLAPYDTPPAVARKLSEAMAKAVQQQDVKTRFAALGIDPVGNTPEEYAAIIRKEVERYKEAVKQADLKTD